MRKVHENVALVRQAYHITKTGIAEVLGLTLQGYRYVENGDTSLDVERLRTIADFLHVEPGIFFDDELTDAVIKEIKMKRITRKMKGEIK